MHILFLHSENIFSLFHFFRKGLGCCLGKCCDSTAATPGNHRFHNCHENQHHDFNEYQWLSKIICNLITIPSIVTFMILQMKHKSPPPSNIILIIFATSRCSPTASILCRGRHCSSSDWASFSSIVQFCPRMVVDNQRPGGDGDGFIWSGRIYVRKCVFLGCPACTFTAWCKRWCDPRKRWRRISWRWRTCWRRAWPTRRRKWGRYREIRMCSKVSGFAPLFVIILLDHNLHLLTVAARSKIRFSETLGHGWFGWVVSGTVAGATKVFLFLRKNIEMLLAGSGENLEGGSKARRAWQIHSGQRIVFGRLWSLSQ